MARVDSAEFLMWVGALKNLKARFKELEARQEYQRDSITILESHRAEVCIVCGGLGLRCLMEYTQGMRRDPQDFIHPACRRGSKFERRSDDQPSPKGEDADT